MVKFNHKPFFYILFIQTCGPVETSFQVDIEIYEDKLGQSGDRILSSHIANIDSLRL